MNKHFRALSLQNQLPMMADKIQEPVFKDSWRSVIDAFLTLQDSKSTE